MFAAATPWTSSSTRVAGSTTPPRPSTSPSSSSPTCFSSSPPRDDALREPSPAMLSARAAANGRGHRSTHSLGGGKLSARALIVKGAAVAPVDARNLDKDALGRMSQDELIQALQAAWNEKDETAVVVADLKAARDALQATNTHLDNLVSRHGAEDAEAEAACARLEDELEGKVALVGRLRDRIRVLEREKREVDRRYVEQTSSFEAERQALYNNEQHLKSRLHTISTRQSSPAPQSRNSPDDLAPSLSDLSSPSSPPGVAVGDALSTEGVIRHARELAAKDTELREIKGDLKSLESGYNSLQQAMARRSTELAELKHVNARLQEDIESYDLLLTERTISGAMRSNSLLSRSYARNGITHAADSLHSVDEQDEDGDHSARSAGELDPDLLPVSQPGSATRSAFGSDSAAGLDPDFTTGATDDMAESRDGAEPAGRTLNIQGTEWVLEKQGARRRKVKGESLGDYAVTDSGMDLAAELGRAEADVSEGGLRKLDKGDDGDALRAEVRSLKEANKALALYTSKILDRILSVDGFETILNADAGNSLQGSIRRTSGTQRGSPSSRPSVMQASTFAPIAEAKSAPAPSVNSTPKPAATPAEEKKTRRSSIDWRGGFASLFGSSSSVPSPTTASPPVVAAPPSSKLRPLSLSPSPAHGSPPRVGIGANGTPSPTAYRPEPQRRKSSLSSSGFSYRSSGSPAAALRTPPVRPEPIDSLVSYFGGEESAFPTALNTAGLSVNERVTDEIVAVRLRAPDEHEQRKAADIASGQAGGFSAPSRRASISSRRASISANGRASEAGQRSPDERKWLEDGQKSAAHDTLFHFEGEDDP